uniref:UbiA family prenyltransferase n=1 Tax=Paenirhodobacter enshiensis TaxID=1105367 RepID=UPI0035AEC5FB
MTAKRPDDTKVPGGAEVPGGHWLVVDLDGTLIRTDMLFETFWSATSRSWTAPVRAGLALMRDGRAGMKRRLSEMSAVDPATLPFTPAVLAFIEAWRAAGGRTALVTASDDTLAQQIADRLGLFDEVHGSDGHNNLKGAAKARFLCAHYGERNFDYIGDSAADIAVWAHARRAIMVGASAALRRRVAATGAGIVDLPAPKATLRARLKLLRPHQWLKNLLVFVPVLAAHKMDLASLGAALMAFCAFSLVASAGYVLNDMLDIASDRAHPRKRRRPLASGAVTLAGASALAPALLVLGAGLASVLGGLFLAVVALYFIVTLSYSLVLKRQPILDICVLAGLYTLRIVAGGIATATALSFWLAAFSGALFFSLAAIKRQAELADLARRGIEAVRGRGYRTADLPLVMAMAIASGYVAILILALYVTSPDVRLLYAAPDRLWAGCVVMFYWISRMVLLTHRGQMNDDPVVFAATDRISLICLGLMAVIGVGATI